MLKELHSTWFRIASFLWSSSLQGKGFFNMKERLGEPAASCISNRTNLYRTWIIISVYIVGCRSTDENSTELTRDSVLLEVTPFLSVAFMEGISCRKVRDLPFCKRWKKYGYCKRMKNRMATYCPHECGFCGMFFVNLYLYKFLSIGLLETMLSKAFWIIILMLSSTSVQPIASWSWF